MLYTKRYHKGVLKSRNVVLEGISLVIRPSRSFYTSSVNYGSHDQNILLPIHEALHRNS